jgi:hypothetical protein
MSTRKQINVRLDEEVLTAIEDIRSVMRPIPTVSEVIRIAILNERDRLKKKAGAKK